jgi:hypothetical protein
MITTTSPGPNTRQPRAPRTAPTLAEKLRTLRDQGVRDKTNGRQPAAPFPRVPSETDAPQSARPSFADDIDRLVADMVRAGDVVFDAAAAIPDPPEVAQ